RVAVVGGGVGRGTAMAVAVAVAVAVVVPMVAAATGHEVYKLLGGLAAVGSGLSFILLRSILLAKKSPGSAAGPAQQNDSWAEKLANRDFIHFLFLMSLLDLMHIFIVITAVGVVGFAGYLVFYRMVRARSAEGKAR
ncbi:MAG: hypothetical protein ACE5ER_08825, partial [Nitrospinaceae bacterium]